MFCANCGKKLPEDAKFCPDCGHVVDEAEQKAQEPDEAPAEAEEPQPTPTAEPTAPTSTQPPSVTPQPTAAPPSTATPQPTPSTPQPAQPTPTPAPTAQPTAQAPGAGQQVPPPPATPQTAPPAGVPPTAAAPKKGGGKCWLIGCGILLVLGIVFAVVGTFMCKKIGEQATATLQNTVSEVPSNAIDIWEPGEEEPTEDTGAGGVAGIIERMGEAAEGLQEAMSAASIEGFDPASVDPKMLPTFYGFMVALAKDDPNAMHKFMSPSYQQEWLPDNWEPAPHIKHLNFRLQGHTKVSDTEHSFVITEGIRDTNDDTEADIVWYITFSRENGKWYVTSFE